MCSLLRASGGRCSFYIDWLVYLPRRNGDREGSWLCVVCSGLPEVVVRSISIGWFIYHRGTETRRCLLPKFWFNVTTISRQVVLLVEQTVLNYNPLFHGLPFAFFVAFSCDFSQVYIR